jgi:hypothetical protein
VRELNGENTAGVTLRSNFVGISHSPDGIVARKAIELGCFQNKVKVGSYVGMFTQYWLL